LLDNRKGQEFWVDQIITHCEKLFRHSIVSSLAVSESGSLADKVSRRPKKNETKRQEDEYLPELAFAHDVSQSRRAPASGFARNHAAQILAREPGKVCTAMRAKYDGRDDVRRPRRQSATIADGHVLYGP
jgi:hypothetical protein